MSSIVMNVGRRRLLETVTPPVSESSYKGIEDYHAERFSVLPQ